MNYPYDFFIKWFPGELNHGTGFYNAILAEMPAAGKLLDLGCGDNTLLASYRYPAREVWGTDFDAHPDLQHPEWFRPLSADGTIPFADNTFDIVTSFMVMEHVSDPARFFCEISRVLKPGGVYVAQSVHGLHYVTWIRRLFDLVPHRWVQRLLKNLYGRDEHDTFPTRYLVNSKRTVASVAQAAKLDWVSWQTYASEGYFIFSPTLFRFAVLLDWSLEKVHAGLGRIYFMVVLRKPALPSEAAGDVVLTEAA
jgi:SAM-dependent methyltransferase